jgi:S-adenosylmethionine:tRNA ribosyltransferase-isomerase
MTDPRNISISDYDYLLPEEKIANYPLPERDTSRLLIYQDGELTEDIYQHLAAHLPENSLLVFNNTKVVEARLIFQKPTGGVIEIFCLEPHEQYPDITTAMLQKGQVLWQCLVGGVSKWKAGQVLEKKIQSGNNQEVTEEILLQATYKEKRSGAFIIELSWSPTKRSFAEILHLAGAIPLPPYIKRKAEVTDTERYQTVYARFDGSVAAPTAGLHFTPAVFHSLQEKNIQTDFVTLHVGAGTFKPVKTETLLEHEMHAEWIDVPKAVIENLLQHADNNIIAVGTTSLRTIESLYWLGRKPEPDSYRVRSGYYNGTGVPFSNDGTGVPSSFNGTGVPSSIDGTGVPFSIDGTGVPFSIDGTGVPFSNDGTGVPASINGTGVPFSVGQWEPYQQTEKNIPAKEALERLLEWMDKNKLDRIVTKTQLLIAPGYEFKIVKGLITNFHQPQSTLLLLVAALLGDDPLTGQAGWKKLYEHALQHDFRFLSYGDGSLLWKKKA